MNKIHSHNAPAWFYRTAFITGIFLFAAIIFHLLFVPGHCLFTTDDNLGATSVVKNIIPQAFFGAWNETPFFGNGGQMPIMWTPIYLWLLPLQHGFNWLHAVDLILASIALSMFLRIAGLRWPGVALGVMTAFWLGSNLTLTYAGHLGKFGVLMFAAASLYGLRKTFEPGISWPWGIITGGFLGLMLMEQQDVGLFFGIFLGAYALFRVVRLSPNRTRVKGFLCLFPMALVALIISGSNLIMIYTMNVSKPNMAEQDNPQQKWEFTTQWSWPPEECVDFIAPGYMGWRSYEPEGPYWGRMGRSAGWEKTGQGFMNFKLENQYLGVIPLVFALFAVMAWLIGGGSNGVTEYRNKVIQAKNDGETRSYADTPVLACSTTSTRAEVYFWFIAAVLALLLSFGKYFPLYYLFYQLPLIGEIRNPNKFLQVFQLVAGILTAYGAHYVFNWRSVK